MNERVMQFRIGMFVIVAGLVLTMLIVWFGESPQLFNDYVYVVVHYEEAPGVAVGIPVRKSGIRVGSVTAVNFDDRPQKGDGVLITLSLERKHRIKAGSVPRLSRSLIGDLSVDLLPGKGPGLLTAARTPENAPLIEGEIAPDPSKALAAATKAFEKAGSTLQSIDLAANGIAEMTKSASKIEEFIDTWSQTGLKVSSAAAGIDRFIAANEKDFQPAVANLRQVSQKVNDTFDAQTQAALKTGVDRLATAFAKFELNMTEAAPLFKDLGAPSNTIPTTDFGITLRRLNLIASDLSLLSRALNDGRGRLNQNGSIQKLLLRTELHDNFNKMAVAANEVFTALRPIVASIRTFADKVARDPSALSRGALQRQ